MNLLKNSQDMKSFIGSCVVTPEMLAKNLTSNKICSGKNRMDIDTPSIREHLRDYYNNEADDRNSNDKQEWKLKLRESFMYII